MKFVITLDLGQVRKTKNHAPAGANSVPNAYNFH